MNSCYKQTTNSKSKLQKSNTDYNLFLNAIIKKGGYLHLRQPPLESLIYALIFITLVR